MAFTFDIQTVNGTNQINLSTTKPSNPALAVRGLDGKVYYAAMECCPSPNANDITWRETSSSTRYAVSNKTLTKYLICRVCYPVNQASNSFSISNCDYKETGCPYEVYVYGPSGPTYKRCNVTTQTNYWAVCAYWVSGYVFMQPNFNAVTWSNPTCQIAATTTPPVGDMAVFTPCCDLSSGHCCYAYHSYDTPTDYTVCNVVAGCITLTNAKGGPGKNICHTWAARQGVGLQSGTWYGDACGSYNDIRFGFSPSIGSAWNIANTNIAIPQNCWGRWVYSAQSRCPPAASVITNVVPNSATQATVNFSFSVGDLTLPGHEVMQRGSGLKCMPPYGESITCAYICPVSATTSCTACFRKIYCACYCFVCTRSYIYCTTACSQGYTGGWCNNAKWTGAPTRACSNCFVIEVCGWHLV